MINNFILTAYLFALLLVFWTFVGWWSAREASRAMPAPDVRQRPNDDQIAAACLILGLTIPASPAQIKSARLARMPRALGDTFPSGQLRSDLMTEIIEAADILEAVNAYDECPPFEARHLLAYWEYRAGITGRLWARTFPPPIVQRLRMQSAVET